MKEMIRYPCNGRLRTGMICPPKMTCKNDQCVGTLKQGKKCQYNMQCIENHYCAQNVKEGLSECTKVPIHINRNLEKIMMKDENDNEYELVYEQQGCRTNYDCPDGMVCITGYEWKIFQGMQSSFCADRKGLSQISQMNQGCQNGQMCPEQHGCYKPYTREIKEDQFKICLKRINETIFDPKLTIGCLIDKHCPKYHICSFGDDYYKYLDEIRKKNTPKNKDKDNNDNDNDNNDNDNDNDNDPQNYKKVENHRTMYDDIDSNSFRVCKLDYKNYDFSVQKISNMMKVGRDCGRSEDCGIHDSLLKQDMDCVQNIYINKNFCDMTNHYYDFRFNCRTNFDCTDKEFCNNFNRLKFEFEEYYKCEDRPEYLGFKNLNKKEQNLEIHDDKLFSLYLELEQECTEDYECKEYDTRAVLCLQNQKTDFMFTDLPFEIQYFRNYDKKCVLMLGEKCKRDSQCFANVCKDGKCRYRQEGQSCSLSDEFMQCDYHLLCKNDNINLPKCIKP